MALHMTPDCPGDDVDHRRVRALSERMFHSLQVRRLTSLRGMPDMLVTQAYRFALDPVSASLGVGTGPRITLHPGGRRTPRKPIHNRGHSGAA
jgi:hypothetical protein